ncbi:hypothetical protein COCNU_15G003270 [Cocos nucifera]|uniref:Uncharacterized protein n=1 Tax=Cocos nucifera TaxID=13894 RepID=A0A8K0IXM5_COCNU|nr:hypothetical protein COCNU_15G003270 [Cocos nucifera]
MMKLAPMKKLDDKASTKPLMLSADMPLYASTQLRPGGTPGGAISRHLPILLLHRRPSRLPFPKISHGADSSPARFLAALLLLEIKAVRIPSSQSLSLAPKSLSLSLSISRGLVSFLRSETERKQAMEFVLGKTRANNSCDLLN